MYGVLKTPSYVQCNGPTGTGNNDFKIQLSTNTALNNKLKDGSTYMLNGRMIALSDGTPPVVTYLDTSVVKVIDEPAPPPDMINKTYVIGLGHVTHWGEVISHKPERSIRLEVTVAHNDWDPVVSPCYTYGGQALSYTVFQNRLHRQFTAKYSASPERSGATIFVKRVKTVPEHSIFFSHARRIV
jgi:hypothetical protein